MLINKLIIEHGYMFVRSIDRKYLKYIMDLGICPLVVSCSDNVIISLHYLLLDCVYNYGNIFDLPSIRPLTVSEIKDILTFASETVFFNNNGLFYLKYALLVKFLPMHIDRNKL